MNNKKLNVFTLSSLIIGPILGSGIILLPPLLYDRVGNYSLIIWAGILVLGFLFAMIFGKLATLYPGDGGVSLATKAAMGKHYQLLTSLYLICAVLFGPPAVFLIAAKFISAYFPQTPLSILGFFIYLLTYALLLLRIDFLGKLMLIVTTAITLIFFISSVNILIHAHSFTFILPHIQIKEIGYSFLIVFWAIVGWEVIGNYSNEVKDQRTLINAVIFSAVIVSCIYFLIALAVCVGDFQYKGTQAFKLVWLLQPLFKEYSQIILSSMSVILCIGTLMLFIGGVSRLISSLNLTKYSSKHLKNGTPIGALNFLSTVYLIELYLVHEGFLTLDKLVASADGFFIANATIGLVTAIILFKNGILRFGAIILSALFLSILLFSNIFILSLIIGLFLFTYFKAKRSILLV
ncbi:MAG: amino acid permease [Sulfurospirillaceae bacterium]|nr:amino acid permease [Sulfurospirillaceae bacterium]